MEQINWQTTKRKVNDLIPYDKNPRRLTEKQEKDLKKSLERFGLAEIPVINLDNKIVAGHQRLKIMQALGQGDEYIDVRIPNRALTDKEFQEYNIRSNKNTGEFDFELLQENFEIDDLKDWGFEEEDKTNIEDFDSPEKINEDEYKPFKKTHILISFEPFLFDKIKTHIENILKIEGIEYEQASN